MTAEDPARCKPPSLDHPVALEGFERIGRARWIVAAAGRKHWRYPHLIAAYQQHKDFSHALTRDNPRSPIGNHIDFNCKLVKARAISFRFRAQQDINATCRRQYSHSRQFTQLPLGAVPIDDVMPVFRNHHADPWMKQQGSRCTSFETLGLHPLPCTPYRLQIGLSRQPEAARKAERFTRQRIWSVTGR